MSRIFDALQRSEGDRAGNEPSVLPKGQELLQEAERRAASNWEAVVSVQDKEAGGVDHAANATPDFVAAFRSGATTPIEASLLTAGQRIEILNRFQSLPISLAPESRLTCLIDKKGPAAEAIRLLAVRLRDFRRSRVLKKVVITSTIPREGKSTVASNLACALARKTDERVLLIEGDLRIPVVMHMFGVQERHPGLCELLAGERELSESVYHLPDAGLWVLPAGSSSGNPLELMQSKQLATVMDQLTACFDWIIIDSPPVLPLADTSIWMRQADGVLLVTRQGITEKKQLKKGLEALEPQKVLGALLNGSKAAKYSDYYYGGSDHSS